MDFNTHAYDLVKFASPTEGIVERGGYIIIMSMANALWLSTCNPVIIGGTTLTF